MNLEQIKRLEASIEFINDGLTFTLGDFVLGKSANGRIFVNGYMNYINVNNIPKSVIEDDFNKMKEQFIELMSNSQKFYEFSANRGIDYFLLVDTGGAGVKICEEVEGVFQLFI
ncbi:MAG: hypothetical protein WC156_14540 [Pedobacter sp.]